MRWIGDVTPGPNQPACQKSEGILILREGDVTFAPDGGTWLLIGKATPDGNLEAEYTRTNSDKTAYDTRLIARWNENTVTGTYTTPRCLYQVTLQRR